jgi:hypothetical protein
VLIVARCGLMAVTKPTVNAQPQGSSREAMAYTRRTDSTPRAAWKRVTRLKKSWSGSPLKNRLITAGYPGSVSLSGTAGSPSWEGCHVGKCENVPEFLRLYAYDTYFAASALMGLSTTVPCTTVNCMTEEIATSRNAAKSRFMGFMPPLW